MRFSARLLLASLLGLAGLSTHVDAHARLGSPAPWNARPSTSQVCGLPRGTAMTNPQVSLVNPAAKVMNVQWFVVIGDGVGPLSAQIDTTGKLNPTAADFKVNLQSVGTNNPNRVSQTPYNVMFTIPPGITCTGPGNTCTLRVRSTSNWVACATIQFQPGAANPGAGGVVTQPRPVTTTRPPIATTRPPTTRPPTTPPPATQPPPVVTNPDDGDNTPETTNPPDNTDNPDDFTPVVTQPPATTAPTPYVLDPSLTDLTIAPEDISGLYGYILDPRSPIFRTSAALDNQCVTPNNLKICSSVNGQSVQLLGPDAASVDTQAGEEIAFALASSTMLTRPDAIGCRQAYIDLMCAQMFPPCGSKGTVVCTSSCQRVNNLCKPNATEIIDAGGQKSSHASLYECGNRDLGFTAIDQDSTGMCPSVSTGVRPTGMNTATSVSSSSTVVFAIVTSLLALVARV